MSKCTCGLAVWLALAMPGAHAASQEIRALFQPDPSQPSKNVFINKTPDSGYCANYPSECVDNSMFSIQLPIRFDSRRAFLAGDAVSIRVPANWRQLTVTNAQTQEVETVEVRIVGIGSDFFLSAPATELTGEKELLHAHRQLWASSSWVNAPAPCLYSGVGAYTPVSYRFFWKTPVAADCTKVAAFDIPAIYFNTLDFAYELRTPNPLGMSSGLYTGSLSYSVGSGRDFDLGPLLVPNDDILSLDFVLDVQHTLKVDLPPGGDKVVLEPEGGWARWLDSGRKPNRIFRDQLFYISASSRFKVTAQCGIDGLFDCMLVDPVSKRSAAVRLSISLPNGLNDLSGQPVSRRYLRIGQVNAIEAQPSVYVDRKPGTLHFEIAQSYLDFLLRSGPATYVGNVIVVWDSEV